MRTNLLCPPFSIPYENNNEETYELIITLNELIQSIKKQSYNVLIVMNNLKIVFWVRNSFLALHTDTIL